MKAVLKGLRSEEMQAEKMKDGDIGILTSWNHGDAVGRLSKIESIFLSRRGSVLG